MTPTHRAAGLAAAALVAATLGCAGARAARMAAPEGPRALGLEFGRDQAAARGALTAAGIAVHDLPGDEDALLADRCPGAPVAGPCRLQFGPEGLYAAQVEAPLAQEAALVEAVSRTLGRPAHRDVAAEAVAMVVAVWERPGWTVGVSRLSPAGAAPLAAFRVEYEAATPPVVAGVPLGRLRADVEHVLDRQGATVIARDEATIAYLGCPKGDPEALSCVVQFRGGRAASVTEVQPTPAEDGPALAAWRALSQKLGAEIGRAPVVDCPREGPDRITGDCTATWPSGRLAIVVGAHRNVGGKHRGAISVYTSFTYPPLAAPPGEEPGDDTAAR